MGGWSKLGARKCFFVWAAMAIGTRVHVCLLRFCYYLLQDAFGGERHFFGIIFIPTVPVAFGA